VSDKESDTDNDIYGGTDILFPNPFSPFPVDLSHAYRFLYKLSVYRSMELRTIPDWKAFSGLTVLLHYYGCYQVNPE